LATELDPTKTRIQKLRTNEDYAATERDSNKVRNQNMRAEFRAEKRNRKPSS
jgi:hypothetical protein